MYCFEFDEKTCVLHMTTTGLWNRATLAAYAAESIARGTLLKIRYGRFAILIDARNFPVQTGEIAQGLDSLMGKTSTLIRAPMAVVVGSTLSKMQAERVLKGDWTRVFLSYDEAIDWLNTDWIQPRGG